MSRGHGAVQRAILALFEASPDTTLDSITIASLVVGRNPVSVSEATSVRRALRRLAAEGLVVDLGRGWRGGRRRWALPSHAEGMRERHRAAFGRGPAW